MSSDRIGDAIDRAFRLIRAVPVPAGVRSVSDLRARVVPVDARRLIRAARLRHLAGAHRRRGAWSATSRTSCSSSSLRLIIRGAIRLVKLFFHQIEEGQDRLPEFPGRMGRPDLQDRAAAARRLRIDRRLPLPAGVGLGGVCRRVGLHGRAVLAVVELGDLECDRRRRPDLYRRVSASATASSLVTTFGDIIETSMLATRVRTIKNEDVTIPNSLVLGGAMTNYSRQAQHAGPGPPHQRDHWLRRALAEDPRAADRCRARDAATSSRTPRPFVWQTALNDFYVTYELNAFTANAARHDGHLRRAARQYPGQVLRRGRARSCRRITRRFETATR